MALGISKNWEIIGHHQQLSLLEKSMAAGRLAHAYIFSGPAQVGKKSIAKKLAQFLLCETNNACNICIQCRTLTAGSNADYIELSGDEDLKIESVRDLTYKLSLKPYSASHKIALIDNAHNLTVEASNALLKIFEEPKPQTLIILVTDNYHRLLPTISSRAQKIIFGPLDELANNNLDKTENQARNEALHNFLKGSLSQRLLLAAELAEKDSMEIRDFLDDWLKRLEKILLVEPTAEMVQKVKSVVRAQKLLGQNVSSKLLLSEMMIKTNQ